MEAGGYCMVITVLRDNHRASVNHDWAGCGKWNESSRDANTHTLWSTASFQTAVCVCVCVYMCHTICAAIAGATLHPQWDSDKMTDESDCRNHYCAADSSKCVKLHTSCQGSPRPMFQMTGPNPSSPASIKALLGHTSLT